MPASLYLYLRVLLAGVLLGAAASSASAQPGATGPIAEMNARAKALSETNPDESLRVAQQALTAAREARDLRGQAEALNYIAYGYRNQSLLDTARHQTLESIRLYVEAGDGWGRPRATTRSGSSKPMPAAFRKPSKRI